MSEQTLQRPASLFALALAFFGSGMTADFVCNGVLKIGLLVIYGLFYIAIANALLGKLAETRWKRWRKHAAALFVLGAIAGHLAFAGRQSIRAYEMLVAGDSPLTLRSGDWPQLLIVTSDPVRSALATRSRDAMIPVVTRLTTDYGCIRDAAVSTVAGIDVLHDPKASWVWKTDRRDPPKPGQGPGTEDSRLPWCHEPEPGELIFDPRLIRQGAKAPKPHASSRIAVSTGPIGGRREERCS